MQDLEIKTNTSKFKYRVNGLVIEDNKLLTIKMKNNKSYCLPGGHVELGEDTITAAIREMMEELKVKVKIEKELAFVESFYTDKNNLKTHELSFYYIIQPENVDSIKMKEYSIQEIDKGKLKQHNFEWLDINSLNEVDFRPECIKEKLIKANYEFEHIIIKE